MEKVQRRWKELGFVYHLGVTGLVVLFLLDYWIPKTEHCTLHCQSPSNATSFPCEVNAELCLLQFNLKTLLLLRPFPKELYFTLSPPRSIGASVPTM